MNLFPGVSLSGSSGSYMASMIENTMISVSESWPNHLCTTAPKASVGKTFETWLRPPVDLGGLRHVPSAGNVQCTLPHGPKLGLARLLLRALFAQLRRCLHRGFSCNGMETRRVSDGRRGWWRKGVAGGRAGRQLTDAGLILDTNHRRVNVAGAFARSSARLERRPQRITRWLAPVGRRETSSGPRALPSARGQTVERARRRVRREPRCEAAHAAAPAALASANVCSPATLRQRHPQTALAGELKPAATARNSLRAGGQATRGAGRGAGAEPRARPHSSRDGRLCRVAPHPSAAVHTRPRRAFELLSELFSATDRLIPVSCSGSIDPLRSIPAGWSSEKRGRAAGTSFVEGDSIGLHLPLPLP